MDCLHRLCSLGSQQLECNYHGVNKNDINKNDNSCNTKSQ